MWLPIKCGLDLITLNHCIILWKLFKDSSLKKTTISDSMEIITFFYLIFFLLQNEPNSNVFESVVGLLKPTANTNIYTDLMKGKQIILNKSNWK